ncbi:MAG: hypothetical protein ACYTFG_14155, partial [Planctomycetota bacterium]
MSPDSHEPEMKKPGSGEADAARSWLASTWQFWLPAGVFLVGLHGALLFLSRRFASGSTASKPILTLVALEVAGGAVFLFTLPALRRTRNGRGLLVWVFLVGVVLRGLTLISTPMLENDYYRYLWDGAVVSRGYNPYAYSPKGAHSGERET